MAYTRTVTMTRPNTGVELPKISDTHADHDAICRTKFAEAGVTKSYTWDSNELVLSVVSEAADKATMLAVLDDLNTLPAEAASMAAVKASCIAVGISVRIADSDGEEYTNF